MKKWIALLRGINVGGNNTIPMVELKKLCEELGFTNVETYINTGNVIFQATGSPELLAPTLESAIHVHFGFAVPTLVISAEQWLTIANQIPAEWSNDTSMKCDVLFLWPSVDEPAILQQLPLKKDIETALYTPGAVIWQVSRDNQPRSGLQDLVGTKLYRQMTIRNCNTVRKIYQKIC